MDSWGVRIIGTVLPFVYHFKAFFKIPLGKYLLIRPNKKVLTKRKHFQSCFLTSNICYKIVILACLLIWQYLMDRLKGNSSYFVQNCITCLAYNVSKKWRICKKDALLAQVPHSVSFSFHDQTFWPRFWTKIRALFG